MAPGAVSKSGCVSRGVAALLGLCLPLTARAGAFLEKPGEGIVIATGSFTDAVRAYDSLGRLVPVAPWRKFELSTYADYGVTDWLTMVASPSLFVFRQDPPGRNREATGIAEVGARARIYEWGDSILSAQVTVRAPLAGASARPFVDTTRFVQIDARAAWGHGFELWGFRGFTDLQVGFRSIGYYGNELRVEGTLGIWAFDPLLLLFQTFTAATPGRIGQSLYLSEKVQASAVYWITPSVGVQVGGTFGLRGVNSDAGRGGFSALWVKF